VCNFKEFISDALTQENNNAIYAATKSHKRTYEVGASQSKALVVAKINIVHLLHPPGIVLHRGRTQPRLAFTRVTLSLFPRIL
jgi:hypothetical protein